MSLIQETINILYRHPKGKLKQIRRQGGLWNTWQINRARKEMERAAQTLKVPKGDAGIEPLEVHFLTGKKYWYQTVFCMYSLQKTTSTPFHFHLCDDGSFDESFIRQIKEQAPATTIHTIREIEERLRKAIPEDRFPFLWHKRRVYPHIKKLTDVHAGTSGWKLVLDSDMLFLQRPQVVIDWLNSPTAPFFILDTQNAYGYSFDLMQNLASESIREKVNVGVIGLQSESINWDNLENWGKELEQQEGTSYYLEQALTAMIIGDRKAFVGPQNDYIVMPSEEQVLSKEGALHHYVDLSKEWYFKEAWKQI
jgi:hypothetical protein